MTEVRHAFPDYTRTVQERMMDVDGNLHRTI